MRSRAQRRGAVTSVFGALAVAVLAVGLTACTGTATPKPTATANASSTASAGASASATPSSTPSGAPTYQPNGSAQDNLAFFDAVNTQTLNQNPNATGQDLVAGLGNAGFDRANMQYTADRTSVNLPAGSFAFSVRIGENCLLGQFGKGSLGYHSEVAPVLQNGACLIGQTSAGN